MEVADAAAELVGVGPGLVERLGFHPLTAGVPDAVLDAGLVTLDLDDGMPSRSWATTTSIS